MSKGVREAGASGRKIRLVPVVHRLGHVGLLFARDQAPDVRRRVVAHLEIAALAMIDGAARLTLHGNAMTPLAPRTALVTLGIGVLGFLKPIPGGPDGRKRSGHVALADEECSSTELRLDSSILLRPARASP